MKVRELMTPVDRFPKIADAAAFYEALKVLETAQENYLSGNIVGKLSPVDLIRGLEPKYDEVEVEKTVPGSPLSFVTDHRIIDV